MLFVMFQSSNNGINADPHTYYKSFFNDITTSFDSKLQFDQSFFNLPSPLDEDDFFHAQNSDFLVHFQEHPPLKDTSTFFCHDMAESHKLGTISKGDEQIGLAMRNRCSKRDRHSKINTAQGPRDRRMRLSLKVAREFFDLQDKLCFDKASKTVEWLLIQSRSAIVELSGTGTGTSTRVNSSSSTSECEVISGIQDEEAAAAIKEMTSSTNNTTTSKAARTGKKARKTALFRPRAKESREKARARARERTRNKQWMMSKKIELEAANNINQFQTATCTGEVEVPATSQLGISGESWAENWSPFPNLTHLYNLEFPQEIQITDFQSLCKPMWESL